MVRDRVKARVWVKIRVKVGVRVMVMVFHRVYITSLWSSLKPGLAQQNLAGLT